MRSSTKIWLSLGTVTTLAAAAGLAGTAEPAQSAFTVALNELFSGEGGQSTLGKVSSGPTVSFKAMTGSELEEALTGNTLRRDRTFAWYFEWDGKLTGWQGNLAPGKENDLSKCKDSDPNYAMSAPGTCRRVVYSVIENGSWSIRGNQICTKPTFIRVAGSECISLFLIADRVVGTRLDTLGKPNDLVKGKQIGYLRR